MKAGTDVTIVGYSRNVKYSLDTIVESVKKTGRLVTVEDGFPQSGIGAEIIALID